MQRGTMLLLLMILLGASLSTAETASDLKSQVISKLPNKYLKFVAKEDMERPGKVIEDFAKMSEQDLTNMYTDDYFFPKSFEAYWNAVKMVHVNDEPTDNFIHTVLSHLALSNRDELNKVLSESESEATLAEKLNLIRKLRRLKECFKELMRKNDEEIAVEIKNAEINAVMDKLPNKYLRKVANKDMEKMTKDPKDPKTQRQRLLLQRQLKLYASQTKEVLTALYTGHVYWPRTYAEFRNALVLVSGGKEPSKTFLEQTFGIDDEVELLRHYEEESGDIQNKFKELMSKTDEEIVAIGGKRNPGNCNCTHCLSQVRVLHCLSCNDVRSLHFHSIVSTCT
eukprot:GHVU01124951.1.p1 GENE.GHVU01124951.1~~GHVU01124951.1.p1  ORF type:complete len:339 (+),score=39.26 GHVU01124951.1:703-1719(+)